MPRQRHINSPELGCSFLSSLLLVASTVQNPPLMGFHPEARLQATPLGMSLHSLHLDEGQLYMGYGDYSLNTGPIAIRSYDIATGTFSPSRWLARTEAISQWRSINGQVFGVMTDANFEPSQGGYFSGTAQGEWSETLVGPSIHSYDIASYNDSLYLAGAGSENASGYAAIHRSDDDGASWNIDLEVFPVGGYGRFYGIYPLRNRLYAFATEIVGTTLTFAVYVSDGGAWSKVSSPGNDTTPDAPMLDLVSLEGAIIGRSNHAGMSLGKMHQFDGNTWVSLTIPDRKTDKPTVLTYDHAVADGSLYGLTSDFRIVKTRDLETWREVVAEVTSNARSLAVVDDCEIYVGGMDGGLYRYGKSVC